MTQTVFHNSFNVDLYHLLSLNPGESNPQLIKKKFTELMTTFHPDKGGDAKFHAHLSKAYQILSNRTKKYIYDNFGLLGVHLIEEEDESYKIFSAIFNSSKSTSEDIEAITNYIRRKILKKIKNKANEEFSKQFLYTIAAYKWRTGILDYYYMSKICKEEVFMGKFLNAKNIQFINNILLYRDNNNKISCGFVFDINPETTASNKTFSLELSKKIALPFNKKIFNKDFFDYNVELQGSFAKGISDINLVTKCTFYNFMNNNSLYLNMLPTLNFTLRKMTSMIFELGYCPTPVNEIKLRYDVQTRRIGVTKTIRINKTQKLTSSLNLGSNYFSLVAFREILYSKKHSSIQSIYYGNSGMVLNNESVFSMKHMSMSFKSSLSFSYSPTKNRNASFLNFSTILTLSITLGSFKFQVPVVVSNVSNILTHSLMFISTSVIHLFMDIKKAYKKRKSKYLNTYNKIMERKQKYFNIVNYDDYLKKFEDEKRVDGLIIEEAFFGEFNKVSEIYKILEIFGYYEKDDGCIFDVKIPLSLHEVNSKLDIPKNISDIEGIFVPDYFCIDNLGLVVKYTFNLETNILLIKNNVKEILLP